jgi:hypothetical protein
LPVLEVDISTILQGRPDIHHAHSTESKSDRILIRTLDDDVAVLAKSRALHGEGEGGPSTGLKRSSEKEMSEAKRTRDEDYLLKSLIVGFIVRHGGPFG